MYIPRHFALEDLDEIAKLVEAVGSADVVTVAADGSPETSLLPVLWDRTPTENAAYGRLIAHAAIMNEQFVHVSEGARALAIVRGEQAYVSPAWYASKAEHGRVVPTWNYSAVHLSGTIELVPDPDRLLEIVTALTLAHESPRPDPWAVSDAPEAFIAGQLKAIVGVIVHLDRVEAKVKQSQNRSEPDQRGVVDGLRASGNPEQQAMADQIEARLQPLFEI
ncbi:MAG: FMN-binding negative transcriptional regulator [Actinomycetes bacterium]